MTNIKTVSDKKMPIKDLKKIDNHIKTTTFRLVGEYYGNLIDQVDKKEKRKLNLKISKIIVRLVHQKFDVTHLKKIKWFSFVDALVYIDNLTIDDLKFYLQ